MAKADIRKTKTRLITELDALRRRVDELSGAQVPSEGEQRYRRLLRLLPDAVRVSCNGYTVYVNEAAVRLFGAKSMDQLLGRKTHDFVLPEDLEHIKARGAMVYSWAGPLPLEEQCRVRLDGSIVHIEIASIEISWQGKPAALTVMRDISARIRNRAALAESEQRLALVAENIPGATYQCELSPNGRIRFPYVSQGVRDLFWLEPDDVMAKGSALMRVFHRDDRKALRQTLRKSAMEMSLVEAEMRVVSDNDKTVWVEIVARPRSRPDGSVMWEGIFLDITERRRSAEILHKAKEAAESASHAKSEFLALMSHELRTPLNAIMGFSEVLSKEMLGPVNVPQYREYAGDIHTSGAHLLDVINDVLDLSKIEAGRFVLHEEDFDIVQVIDSSVRTVKQRSEDTDLKISVRVDDKMPRLHADQRKVKQILLNLLSNASKFTPDGGRVTISASASAVNGMEISVADTGIGIRKDDIKKVMSPFGQAGNVLTREHEGTGLGLPLTKSLVEEHGGCFNLKSRFGKGTKVTVRFPADRLVA